MDQSFSTSWTVNVAKAVRERSVLTVAILLVVPLAFVTYSLLTPRVYRAVVTLAPAASDRMSGGLDSALGQLGGIAALAGLSVGRKSSTEEAVAVLRSRSFTERFLDSSGAMNDILLESFGGRPNRRYKVYKYFDSNIRSVSENRRTGLYTVSIEWIDRHKAAMWSNSLIQQLNAEMRVRAIDETDQNLKFLNDQLAVAEQLAVRDAIGRLIEAQVKQRMLASVTEEYVFRVVDPALPPAREEYVHPNPVLFGLAGIAFAVSLIVGVAIVRSR